MRNFVSNASRSLNPKQILLAILFTGSAILIATLTPSTEIAWVCAFLLLTIYLFAFEIVAVDVAAFSIMVLLGLTSLLAPFMGLEKGLVDTNRLFDGFSSNAVMSIIAVMILGAGLDKTGLMGELANFILKRGGRTEKRIVIIISTVVGTISSFLQNVGAAALFLPVVSRISARSGLPMSRLLMPMGFCAILGGTLTMVGSSPLILLNDLIILSNANLSLDNPIKPWGFFAVTPIGIVLLMVGIAYFVFAGRFVLPITRIKNVYLSRKKRLKDVYGIDYDLFEMVIPDESPLVGKYLDDIESDARVRIIALQFTQKSAQSGLGELSRDSELSAGQALAILADAKDAEAFEKKYALVHNKNITFFEETLAVTKAGLAEVLIPPSSSLIGKSARDIWMRKTYGLAMVALHRDGTTLFEGDDIRSAPFHVGDTLIVHTNWDTLSRIENDKDFLVITTEYPKEETRPNKVLPAAFFFTLALSLVLFTDIRLSIALLAGAVGMILSGVLNIEEAYQAVSWKTVFLLASLIPLGLAAETSGTAHWIAQQILSLVGDMPIWVIQTAVALLATGFTLIMSNVGATVLLVPLAINIAIGVDADPALFALLVALSTSNSFLIPTHQVNVLIMGPAGYRVRDFIRAGSIMTLLFLITTIAMINILF